MKKKQLIAATLLASMVLTVGYANKADVKVTTHEGNVVEAKAGIDSLKTINGLTINNYPAAFMLAKDYNIMTPDDSSSIPWERTIYIYKDNDLKLVLKVDKNSNRVNSVSTYTDDVDLGYGMKIGNSISDIKKSIPLKPKYEWGEDVGYDLGDTTVQLRAKDGKLVGVDLLRN